MKKGLVTAFVIASVLAFNACKKEEGPVGPTGATGATGANGTNGATGAAGATGPVGATGAKGADGTKILTGTTAPAAGTGADGDYYFDSASKTLYGPKAAGAWPAGTSLEGAAGANGATGATGAKGTQFLAGPGAPDAATGNEGDYYFDTTASVFYGPKSDVAGSEWSINVFPLASAHAAKTFYLSGTLQNVVETVKKVGHSVAVTYPHSGPSDEIQATGVTYNTQDMLRLASYPGWKDNREMIFESNPVGAPGIFDYVPQDGAVATWSAANALAGPDGLVVGRRFRFTQNFANPTAEFNLTADDIARFTSVGGTYYSQYVYGKVIEGGPTSRVVAVGEPMYFYRTKHVTVTNNASGPYRAQYTASTTINWNTIPGLGNKLETYKQDGKVFAKYRYVNASTGAARFETAGVAGWVDLTHVINDYTLAGASYGPAGAYTTVNNNHTVSWNPFGGGAGLAGTAGTVGNLGTVGSEVWAGANQRIVSHSSVTRPQVTVAGNYVFHWDIWSGSNPGDALVPVPFGPITLDNSVGTAAERLNPVAASWSSGVYNMTVLTKPHWKTRVFANDFYLGPRLTATLTGTTATFNATTGIAQVLQYVDGKDASFFQNRPIVQVQVFVVPGDIVKAAKTAGINVNNPEALSNFAKSLRLQ